MANANFIRMKEPLSQKSWKSERPHSGAHSSRARCLKQYLSALLEKTRRAVKTWPSLLTREPKDSKHSRTLESNVSTPLTHFLTPAQNSSSGNAEQAWTMN